MPAEKLAWIRLAMSENVGPASFRELLKRYGTAIAALEALPEISRRGRHGAALAHLCRGCSRSRS